MVEFLIGLTEKVTGEPVAIVAIIFIVLYFGEHNKAKKP